MRPVGEGNIILSEFLKGAGKVNESRESKNPKDSAVISNTSRAFARLDKFLNLGRPDRLDIADLNDSEKKEFLKMLAVLLKKGIVGYEILEVNGKPEKHFIVNEIGNERIYGAKLYKKKGFYRT